MGTLELVFQKPSECQVKEKVASLWCSLSAGYAPINTAEDAVGPPCC